MSALGRTFLQEIYTKKRTWQPRGGTPHLRNYKLARFSLARFLPRNCQISTRIFNWVLTRIMKNKLWLQMRSVCKIYEAITRRVFRKLQVYSWKCQNYFYDLCMIYSNFQEFYNHFLLVREIAEKIFPPKCFYLWTWPLLHWDIKPQTNAASNWRRMGCV